MLNYRALFEGKKVTVLGLGLLGRGVGDVEFLAKCGAHVLVTDMKTEEQLAESVEKLKQYKNVSFKLGGHDENDFVGCDLVIKGAKTPLNSPYIAAAQKAGVPVMMSTALFARYAMQEGVLIVGITGTRGKSTVTHLIHHALQKAGRPVHLGGNVRGVSTLALLPDIKRGDVAVLELDSWQLQGFGELHISPHVSVFTNLMPDHQDYYGGLGDYFTDKANIFRNQKHGDALFVGPSVVERVQAENPPVEAIVPSAIPKNWSLQILGFHNRENAALAAATLRTLGLQEQEIKSGIESFPGLEGRLQFVGEKNDVRIYNDNNSTTPEATVAALRALDTGKNGITLITGGSEKGLELAELVKEIKLTVQKLILLEHPHYAGSERFAKLLEKEGVPFERAAGIRPAVELALQSNPNVMLFSPAFASFGMFKNEYERNDRFLGIVQSL
jgi:UDP-N-acetylmuramoylalanine--D-glutamate ligase